MDNIINLLNIEISLEQEIVKSLSVELRNIKHIYDCLIPNKNKKDIISTEKLRQQDIFYEFMGILSSYNTTLYDELIKIGKKIINNRKDSLSQDSFFLPLNSITHDDKIKPLSQMVKQNVKIYLDVRTLLFFSANYMVEFYENLENEKETKKDLKKRAEYALRNIKNNLPLTTKDINTITLLIQQQENMDKEELFSELNGYIDSKKSAQIKTEENVTLKEKSKSYVDDEKQVITEKKQDKKNPIIRNYLITIRSFNYDTNAINEFLNAISYNDDIEDIISEMLLEINPDEEAKLYEVISNYLTQITCDEFKEDEIKEDEEVNVLFYDFTNNSNKMIDIIDKEIPKEDYKSILKALELIKKDGATSNRTRTVSLKKIYKLRVGKIRVTFKRLNHNTYIILGIFRKKNQSGSEIIAKTKARNDKFSMYEKSILSSFNVPEIGDKYLRINEEIYENIKNKLKLDKDNKHIKV